MFRQSLAAFPLCSWLLAIVIPPASADTITLQPVADTTLFQNMPNNNLGGLTNFIAGTLANGSQDRALIKFDPNASLPAGAAITSVTLTLAVTAFGGASSVFDLHPLLADWGEGTKTGQTGAPASSGEATWNARFNSVTLWSAAGGAAGSDYASAVSGTDFINGLGSFTFSSAPGMVSDVQNWLNNPSSNFGWLLASESEATATSADRFASREDALGRGPELTIDYTVVPEPSTARLVCLAAGIFLCVRYLRLRPRIGELRGDVLTR